MAQQSAQIRPRFEGRVHEDITLKKKSAGSWEGRSN